MAKNSTDAKPASDQTTNTLADAVIEGDAQMKAQAARIAELEARLAASEKAKADAEALANEYDGDARRLAKRVDQLESALTSAEEAPKRTSGLLRAKHNLAIVVGGERKDIAAGDLFEAEHPDDLKGLKHGEHFESAEK